MYYVNVGNHHNFKGFKMNTAKQFLSTIILISIFLLCSCTQDENENQPQNSSLTTNQKEPENFLSITNRGKPVFKFVSHKDKTEESDLSTFKLFVSYKNSVIHIDESYFQDPVATGKIIENAPRDGCQSIITYSYSGGAHCCTTAILATSCKTVDSLIKVDLQHNSSEDILNDLNGDGIKELVLYNWDFAYFSPDENHDLCFAVSPSMLHYAIWTQEGWKITRPGDLSLKNIYTKLMNEQLNSKPSSDYRVGRAITTTYYALMAGEDNAKAKNLLTKLLPKHWKPITNRIFSTIESSAANFNPIEVGMSNIDIMLSKNH